MLDDALRSIVREELERFFESRPFPVAKPEQCEQRTTPLLSINDVAEKLQVSSPTVRRLISTGQLKSVRVMGQHRITERELSNFIEGQSV